MATHLGVVDEEAINNMSIVFFEAVLAELGHKLMYDAVVNFAGNAFCEKSWEIIMDHYPMDPKTGGGGAHSGLSGIAKFVSKGNVKVMEKGSVLPGTLGQLQKKGNANG